MPTITQHNPPYKPARPWQQAFLAHYAITGNISESCRRAQIDRTTYYEAKNKHPDFAQAVEQAAEAAADYLEQVAWHWATQGIETTETKLDANGNTLETKRTTHLSPAILIFLLKATKPHKYRDNIRVEQTGPNGGPIQVELQVSDIAAEFDAELRRLTETTP